MSAGNRHDWDAICAAAAAQYPSIQTVDFQEHLDHPATLGNILRDFVRLDSPGSGRGGRVTPEIDVGVAQINELLGNSYNMEPFTVALAQLTSDSKRQIARKTGIGETRVHRLRTGATTPELYDMEALAAAYHRRPEWFADYRVKVIVGLVTASASSRPEQTAVLIRKILPA